MMMTCGSLVPKDLQAKKATKVQAVRMIALSLGMTPMSSSLEVTVEEDMPWIHIYLTGKLKLIPL